MLVFATETSCDETSVCLMNNKEILEHLVFSQEIHGKYGGVVPELASRSHLEKLQEITIKLLNKSKVSLSNIDVFTSTCGPGLIGSLLVGSTFTKALALNLGKPFIPINHLEGHVLSTSFNNKILYPHLVLLLTGGHTQIYLMKDEKQIILLGETLDDAIGEAFDKVAKLLGLSYPGGALIEEKAKTGDENFFKLPKPLINDDSFNFSFSGLKTYVNILIKKNEGIERFSSHLSASFQKTIFDIINEKVKICLKNLKTKSINIKSISVVGGVANNEYIKKKLENEFFKKDIKIFYPLKEMISDNAAMIAWACIKNYTNKKNNIFFKPEPRMQINNFFN